LKCKRKLAQLHSRKRNHSKKILQKAEAVFRSEREMIKHWQYKNVKKQASSLKNSLQKALKKILIDVFSDTLEAESLTENL